MKVSLRKKALPTKFLSQRKFDQRNVYFLVKVFACKKVLAQVFFFLKKKKCCVNLVKSRGFAIYYRNDYSSIF